MVVGAGFIGLEMAATARLLGLDVTVVETAATPTEPSVRRPRSASGSDNCTNATASTSAVPSRLQEISADGRGFTLRFARRPERLPADVVVVGVGSDPADIDWLDGSGHRGRRTGFAAATPTLRTSVPDVVAAGDVGSWHNSLFGEDMRVEHWTNAVEQGVHAAGPLLGDRQDYFASVPYFWTDQFDAKLRFVGRASGA